MARTLSQTLNRVSSSSPSILSKKSPPYVPSSRFLLNHRNRSNQSEKSQLIEVDLDQENEVEVLGYRRLDDVIHGIIVKRSAPDWLPFIPGSSYWVPPRKRHYGFNEIFEKFANPMTEEEHLSLNSVRGFPSSAYFVENRFVTARASPYKVEMETNSKATQSEDEEG